MYGSSLLNPCKTEYYTNIYLIRAQTYLSVIWQYKIKEKIIFLDLQLDCNTYSTSRNLVEFLKAHAQEVR